jgi:tryptophan synthase beta chain
VCNLVNEGLIEAEAYFQTECFEAARLFLKTEGFLPAPETSHAIKSAIETAKRAKPGEVVVFLYSGHGLLDLGAYDAFFQGRLTDFDYPEESIVEALKSCPKID